MIIDAEGLQTRLLRFRFFNIIFPSVLPAVVHVARFEDVTDEKRLIEATLAETRGRVSGPWGAAVRLGMPASTLESKVRSLKINKHSFKTG